MGIVVYSVPHTGTRFVQSFFEHCGIETTRRHVGQKVATHADDIRVIPVRNPYDSYLSWQYLHPGSELDFIGMWGKLVWKSKNAFFFPLDIDPKKRVRMLCSALWNARSDILIDNIWEAKCRAFEWKPVSQSDRNRHLECPDEIKRALSFAYEWYEYYTVNWGLG